MFTDEFKAGAVRLVLEEGKTVGQVARDLDLTASASGSIAPGPTGRTAARG
jgi:transposase-like protein